MDKHQIRKYKKALAWEKTSFLLACWKQPTKYMGGIAMYLLKQELIKRGVV